MTIKTCVHCGAEFEARCNRQATCPDECRKAKAREYMRPTGSAQRLRPRSGLTVSVRRSEPGSVSILAHNTRMPSRV